MQLLLFPDLKSKGIPWSRQHVHRLVREKKFPAPIKIGENTNAWDAAEIDAYLKRCKARRDAATNAQVKRGECAMPVTDEDLYLVWSNEHRGWWKRGAHGYSAGLNDAARMSRKAAVAICRRAIPQSNHLGQIAEIPVRLDDVDDFLGNEMPPAAILWGTKDMVR